MAQAYPVVGIQDSGIQPRLEIRDLQKKPIQFSLFIQAYNNILNMTNSDQSSSDYLDKPNSWWQIGGIHGLPYQPWSGDPNGPQTADPNSGYGGYCYHSSALFPTWHRVLVLLTEQAIVREAIAIATNLEETDPTARSEKWVQAANELRHPYWDWTKTETATEGIPQIFQDPQVQIVKPGDATGTLVDNPLNHYNYAAEPGTVQGFEYMATWKRTYRWVNQNINPTEEQYNLALKAFSVGATLNFGGEDISLQPVHWLRGKVAALFNYPLTLEDASYGPNLWGFFSNTGAASAGVFSPVSTVLSSIEESHNMVHLDTGGNGSMSMNEYAGLDPIFYMHHTNVDRLYAFWEYVYPNYWIENGWKNQQGETVPFENSDSGNFQQDPDAAIDHATSLIPFRNADLNYWISDDTRSLLSTSSVNKYYTYPAITDPRSGVEVKVDVPYDTSDEALREEYRQALLYEWDPEIHKALKTVKKLSANLKPQHRNLLLQEHEASGTSRLRHFAVQAKVPEFAFPGSHRLELLVHTKNQQGKVHVVNSTSVLSRANTDQCAACKDRQAAGNQIRGYMPLDPRIVLYLVSQLDHAELAVLTDLDKLSILVKESLGTRLVKPDGTVLAVADTRANHPNNEALDAAKAPELTLHSHTIAFDHNAYSGDVAPAVKLEDHTNHGYLGDKESWKII